MLYVEPKPKPKADALLDASLIAWLRAKPANGGYCYANGSHCLLSQYFTEMGFRDVEVTPERMFHADGEFPLPRGWNAIAMGTNGFAMISDPNYHTFGAALRRAGALTKGHRE